MQVWDERHKRDVEEYDFRLEKGIRDKLRDAVAVTSRGDGTLPDLPIVELVASIVGSVKASEHVASVRKNVKETFVK